MEHLTFEELKKWLSDNKEYLRGITVRVESYKEQRFFKTLKDLGNYILKVEAIFPSATVYSYSTKSDPRRFSFKDSKEAKEILSQGNVNMLLITVGYAKKK